jgi:hypothetical protein
LPNLLPSLSVRHPDNGKSYLSFNRGEDLKKLVNQKQELPMAAMFVNGSGQNVQSLERIVFTF